MKKSLTVIFAVLLALFVFVSCEQSVGDLIGFNLVFKANGGTGTMETVFIKGSSAPAPVNKFERTGYTFSSWNTMADGSGTEYKVGDTINGHDVQSVTLFAQWTAVPYNITINNDPEHGMVVAMYNGTYTTSSGEIYIPLVATPAPGYKLFGYNVTGASIFDNEYLMIAEDTTGDITVTPSFEKVVYTITVNDTELGSGSAEVTGYTISNYTNVVTLSAAPYSAYSDYVMLFDWQLSAPAGVTIANGTISIPADTIGDITVTPVFTPKTGDIYLVTLHTAGGTIAEGQDVAFYKHGDGTTVLLPTSVTRTESSFKGWYDNSGYTGNAVTSFLNSDTGNKEFWALWDTNSYIVSLDTNGGTIAEGHNVTSYTYGYYKALPTSAYISKTGYTFGGWYDNEGCTGNPVTAISSTDTGNKTFYAKWTVNNYTVAFKKNAESATGTMADEAFDYGEGKALTSNAFARTGYTFSGWNTVAGGTGDSYTNGQVVSNLTSIDDETVNLYAQWTANEYTVTFDGNGGSTPSSKTVTYGSTYGSLTDSSWTGHTFLGWFTAAEGGTEVTSTTSVTILEAQTLYAHWSLNNYFVAFNKNAESATGTMANEAFDYGEVKALTSNAFARTGYTFSGWNTVAGGTGNSYTNGQVVSNLTSIDDETVNLYAQWTANEYTVTFDGNGGSTPSSKTVTYDSTYGYLTDSSWTGHTFLGWFTAAEGGTEVTSDTNVTILDNQTLYAHWSLNNYTVAFNKNAESATGTMTNEAFDYGEVKALTSNAFARTGYTFSGWNTVAGGTGNSYTNGQVVSNLTSTDEDTVDLYAQWDLDVYSVTITSGTEGYTVAPSATSYSISDPDQVITLTIDPLASVSSYSYEGPTTATIVTDWSNNQITIKSGSYGGDIKITCYF